MSEPGKILLPTNIQFVNSTFNMSDSGKNNFDIRRGIQVFWNSTDHTAINHTILFDGCTFINHTTSNSAVENTALYTKADKSSRNNKLNFSNCSFRGGYSYDVFLNQGGTIKMYNVNTESKHILFLDSNNEYHYNAELQNINKTMPFRPVVHRKKSTKNSIKMDVGIKKIGID